MNYGGQRGMEIRYQSREAVYDDATALADCVIGSWREWQNTARIVTGYRKRFHSIKLLRRGESR